MCSVLLSYLCVVEIGTEHQSREFLNPFLINFPSSDVNIMSKFSALRAVPSRFFDVNFFDLLRAVTCGTSDITFNCERPQWNSSQFYPIA